MQMFTLIAYAVIILTAAVILLSAFAVLGRYLSDLREGRIQHIRKRMQRALDGCLAGTTDLQTAIRELEGDREIALSVLIDKASRLSRDARSQLRIFFGHFQFVQQEITALHMRRWPMRLRAATRLGYMSHEIAIPELMKSLDDEMLDVRLAAAHALALLGAVQAARPILRSLALPGTWPLQRSTEILYEMGPAVIEPLLAFLGESGPQASDPSVAVAVRVLGMLRVAKAVPQVVGLSRSPDAELRLCCAKALGQMGDAQAVDALSALLKDAVWEVRSAAAQALGRLGNPVAIPALGNALPDPAWWVRFNAAEGLYQLGAEGQVILKSTMVSHTDGFARDICRQILEEHGAIAVREALSP